jgi:hypothetical protein
LLDNSKRGVWHLTAQGADTSAVDPKLVKRYVQGLHAAKGKANSQEPVAEVPEAEPEDDWREILLRRLSKCRRMLLSACRKEYFASLGSLE